MSDDCKPCNDAYCEPLWDFSTSGDECIIKMYEQEAIDIAGAPVHVFKLLGVNEQGSATDLTDHGEPLASSSLPLNPPSNVFVKDSSYWSPIEKGTNIINKSYIGYLFETRHIENLRRKYTLPEIRVNKHVTSLGIKLAGSSKNHSTRFRVERSNNGRDWLGVAIIEIADSNDFQVVSFKESSTSVAWRIVPLNFLGGPNDRLMIERLEFYDKREVRLDTFTDDPVFKEMRSRRYASESITLKCYFEITEPQTEILKTLVDMINDEIVMKFSFATVISKIGRPIIIGDIIEIPALTQYSADNKPIPKVLEVVDVTWDSQFTPNWVPSLLKVTAKIARASEETESVFKNINADTLETEQSDKKYQNLSDITDNIENQADNELPMKGVDLTELETLDEETLKKAEEYGINLRQLQFKQTGTTGEDALPPNSETFTEGNNFPSSPNDGDYHRLTYDGIPGNIPARLYRYSASEGRWIFVEEDRKTPINKTSPSLDKFLSSLNRRSPKNKKL